jgi:pimeloyl-ACP methyl ester carboxylesterase
MALTVAAAPIRFHIPDRGNPLAALMALVMVNEPDFVVPAPGLVGASRRYRKPALARRSNPENPNLKTATMKETLVAAKIMALLSRPRWAVSNTVLVANGDTDVLEPSINSVELARKLPHSELSIFPDAGHGAIFQYHSAFLDQTLRFLRN